MMHYLYVSMPKKRYLRSLRAHFTAPFWLFDERITGLVLGPFFAVAHYQGHEWNRRITNECNRAYGFVREREGELEICYFRWKGLLAPGWVAVYTLLCRSIFLVYEIRNQDSLGWMAWVTSLGITLMVCAGTAIAYSVTEAGMLGVREVDKFLTDPENYYC